MLVSGVEESTQPLPQAPVEEAYIFKGVESQPLGSGTSA